MVTVLPITVVNEAAHPVDFDMDPIDPAGKTYAMQIRLDPAASGTPEATFTPLITGTVVRMTGDCTNLDVGVVYHYDIVEDDSVICTGTVSVIQRVTK